MKNFVKLAVVASAAALCLVACAKKQQPQTEPEAAPAPAAVAPAAEPNADSLAAEQARLEAERLAAERARLEAERARLEALINQIMSEDVYFDFDRSELTEKAKELLAQVGELLIKEERFTITIEESGAAVCWSHPCCRRCCRGTSGQRRLPAAGLRAWRPWG